MLPRPPRSTLFPYTTPSDLFRPESMSNDIRLTRIVALTSALAGIGCSDSAPVPRPEAPPTYGEYCNDDEDRKSTRLNSSHGYISYAVFCLKKKKKYKRSIKT